MSDLTPLPPKYLDSMMAFLQAQPPHPPALVNAAQLLTPSSIYVGNPVQSILPLPTQQQFMSLMNPNCIPGSTQINPLFAYQQFMPQFMPITGSGALPIAPPPLTNIEYNQPGFEARAPRVEIKTPPARPIPTKPMAFQEKKQESPLVITKSIEPHFEMGKMCTTNYMPTHHMKGTMIRLNNGKLKKCEDISSDDIMQCSGNAIDMKVEIAVVKNIIFGPELVSVILELGPEEGPIDVQPEFPFYVLGKGWTSPDPVKTRMTYGMDVEPLMIQDICMILLPKELASQLSYGLSIHEAQVLADRGFDQAILRDEAANILAAIIESGRMSAPPPRFRPYEKLRTFSDSQYL